jgi:hypothetical protein
VASGVRFRLQPLDVPPPSGGTVPRNHMSPDAPIEPQLAEAWRQHAMVTALPAFQKLPHHFGVDSAQTVFECDGAIALRCVATGPYLLEARTAAEVARLQVFVPAYQERPLVVRLEPARVLRGMVVDAERGTPVEAVEVAVRDGGLGPAPATSDAGGAFQLGPLSRAPVTVHARKTGYAEAEVGPVSAGDEPVRVLLRPHARREIHGRVRTRLGGRPLPGASVAARGGGAVDGTAVTGADGTFTLMTALEDPEVVVRADGHVEWVEVIAPGGPAVDFDLIPARPDARVAAGLSALLSGRVLGPDGKPAAGVPIALHCEQPPQLTGIAGRRILSGALVPGEPMRVADADGRFVLECTQPGPARLVVVDGVSPPEQARVVQVQLGTHLRDLELRASR